MNGLMENKIKNEQALIKKNFINFVLRQNLTQSTYFNFKPEVIDIIANILCLCDYYNLRNTFYISLLWQEIGELVVNIFPSMHDREQDVIEEISVRYDEVATITISIDYSKFRIKDKIDRIRCKRNLCKSEIYEIINEIAQNKFNNNLIDGEVFS